MYRYRSGGIIVDIDDDEVKQYTPGMDLKWFGDDCKINGQVLTVPSYSQMENGAKTMCHISLNLYDWAQRITCDGRPVLFFPFSQSYYDEHFTYLPGDTPQCTDPAGDGTWQMMPKGDL